MDKIKTLMIASSLLAAGGAYLYSVAAKDEYEEKATKLKELLKELKAAYIPVYVRAYNMYVNSVRELKDKKDSKEFVEKCVKEKVDNETHKIDKEIWEKYGIKVDELSELLEIWAKEEEVVEMRELIEENNKKIFEGKRPDFKLEYPDKITSELYFEILTTVFECIRNEAYCRLRYKIRENNGSKPKY